MAIAAGTSPSIALATKSSNNNQVFTAVANSTGFYLKSNATGKVIGLANDATFSGALVEQRTASGHATQRFVANSLGGGVFTVRNLGSGYYLHVIGNDGIAGRGLNQSSFWNTCGQKFRLESVSLAERSALSTIQAESFTSQYGSQTNSGIVGYLDSGDYLHYRALDFGAGAKSLSLLVAVPPTEAGKKIEVRLDGKTGALVGSLTVQDTGSWSTFKAQAINLSTTVTGIHDLYLVMSDGADVANIDSFMFSSESLVVVEPPPPTIPAERSAYATIQAESYSTQSGSQVMGGTVGYLDAGDYLHFKAVGFDDGAKSVSFAVAVPSTEAGKKIEVRLDSKTGALVGSLVVQNTGDWSAYASQAINLTTTVTGVRDLYLVMAGGANVANIDSLVFSKQTVSTSTPEPTPEPTSAPTPTPTTGTKRWFPGHYLYAADDVNHLGMMDSRRNLVRTNPYFMGYKNQYWWHRLEPKKGVYDFSMILNDLDKAHADGKKMIIMLMERSFHGSARPFPVPAYIRDEYNGVWSPDGKKIFIKTWDPVVTERYIRLVEAVAKAVDNHPAFQMIWTEESGMSLDSSQSGYSHEKVANYWSNLSKRASAATKYGIFAMNFNWGLSSNSTPSRQQVTDEIVYTNKCGIGASDLRIDGSTGSLTTSFGYVFDRYQGTTALHASVEYNTFAKGWSAKELLDFGVDRMHLNFIGWMARTSTSGVDFNIYDAIEEINRQRGRVNKSRPKNVP
jgi:hypothetical protein